MADIKIKWILKAVAIQTAIFLMAVNGWSNSFTHLSLVRKLYRKPLPQIPAPGKISNTPLFKRSFTGIPDTLEIFVMYVEFQAELPEDNTSTTGEGTFNSAHDSTFNLDPYGKRRHRYYLDKHMEFARDYFSTISEGRLVITWKMFPRPDENGYIEDLYTLSKRIAAYNPTKLSEDKRIVF